MRQELDILISSNDIQKRVKELAESISADYAETGLMVIGILKAAWIFTADIIREIRIPVTCDFIRAASYAQTASSGTVTIIWDVKPDMVEGKNILLVDTVLDTGLTMKSLVDHFHSMNPRSLHICVLLDKPSNRKVAIHSRYTGFTIPGHFVVGYGLDMDDAYRNLPYIASLK